MNRRVFVMLAEFLYDLGHKRMEVRHLTTPTDLALFWKVSVGVRGVGDGKLSQRKT